MVRSTAPSPLESVIAGASAGGVESLVTYPTEYIKTRKQLLQLSSSPLRLLLEVARTSGISSLYTGAGAFCVSNASKSGVRFLTFDTVRARLPKDARTGKPTAPSSMMAGVVAGVAEGVAVVTPGENIKTKMIESPSRFGSSGQVVRHILATNGPSGLFRGIVPVTLKQGSNALVRFTSYTVLAEAVDPGFSRAGHPGLVAPVAGAAAGMVTVYATMPFDSIKTKMQAVGADRRGGMWECLASTVRQSGPRSLWRGTTPRLARLCVSGALSFAIYERTTDLLSRMGGGSGEAVVDVTAKL